FQSTRLPFTAVQLKMATISTWDTTFFNRFFPLKPERDHSSQLRRQNFDKCSYFLEWHTLIARLPLEDVKKIRAALLPWWRTLIWLPYSGSDRMWDTRPWKD
ncbi:hypothetical protein BDY19DRAFT_875179, partial [Irpex rosettiformis]